MFFCSCGYLGRGISGFNKGPHETNFGEFGISAVFEYFMGCCVLLGSGIQRWPLWWFRAHNTLHSLQSLPQHFSSPTRICVCCSHLLTLRNMESQETVSYFLLNKCKLFLVITANSTHSSCWMLSTTQSGFQMQFYYPFSNCYNLKLKVLLSNFI